MIWVVTGVYVATLAVIAWRARRRVAKVVASSNKTVADCNRRTSRQVAELRAANRILLRRANGESHRADHLAMENARLRLQLAEQVVTL